MMEKIPHRVILLDDASANEAEVLKVIRSAPSRSGLRLARLLIQIGFEKLNPEPVTKK